MSSDPSAEALGGERRERLRGGAHQQAVDRLLVLESDLGHRLRQGEDNVEVGNRQQLGLTGGEPLRARRPLTFPAMAVSARVVGDAGKPAIVTALDVAAERRRAAGRDRSDHAPLHASEMSGVRPFVTFAVSVENVGQFERRPNLHRLSRRRHDQREFIERTGRAGDHLGRDVGIACRRFEPRMSEQDLNDPNVDPALQKMRCEAMPQHMHAHMLVEPSAAAVADRQAACSTLGSIGVSAGRPGNRNGLGRASRQYSRRMPSSVSESMA